MNDKQARYDLYTEMYNDYRKNCNLSPRRKDIAHSRFVNGFCHYLESVYGIQTYGFTNDFPSVFPELHKLSTWKEVSLEYDGYHFRNNKERLKALEKLVKQKL